jgi:hypothetical protein
MELSADTRLTMFAYAAESGAKSEQALNLLASWSATSESTPSPTHLRLSQTLVGAQGGQKC